MCRVAYGGWHIDLLCVGLHRGLARWAAVCRVAWGLAGALVGSRPTWEYRHLGLALSELWAEGWPDTGVPGVYFPPNTWRLELSVKAAQVSTPNTVVLPLRRGETGGREPSSLAAWRRRLGAWDASTLF